MYFFRTGKTKFVEKLIRFQFFTKKIRHVFYFGAINNLPIDWDNKLPDDVTIKYQEGLPTTSDFINVPKRSVIVIDDQFSDAVNSPDIHRAFNNDRRKFDFNLILITQNPFEKGKFTTGNRRNTEITVLLRMYADQSHFKIFGKQYGVERELEEAVKDMKSRPEDVHAHIVINGSIKLKDQNLKVMSNIFGDSPYLHPSLPICYTQKNH